ncbi:ubiquinone/menaquinone biosynthesis C-methylase UbiE [Catenulispora sp. GP43]|uniref:class I SAM-dependent methyltransferase n=1 Tax=Catenulispora sp. GP43 TaxID=3156263 RepID=UPI0035177DA2
MRRTNYDTEQYQDYARGRALTEEQMRTWIEAFSALLPKGRPLAGLDVGSGTGRFTPALAGAFGPVTGIEPSVRMREVAQSQSQHPDVRYLAGSAEDIPVPTDSADYAVLLLCWHHVQDKPKAARELARVVRPGGRLIIRSGYGDQMPWIWWLEHFPNGFEKDAVLFPPLHEVIETFTSSGWRVRTFGPVTEPSPGTYREMLERLRLRTHTIFGHFTPEETATGFEALERAVAADPDAPAPAEPATLLSFERR